MLCQNHGYTYKHFGPPLDKDSFMGWDILELLNRRMVFDRFHIGETVYPFVKGRQPVLKYQDFQILEEFMKIKKTILIYCRPPKSMIFEMLKQRKDDFIDETEVDEIVKNFDKGFSASKLIKFRVDPFSIPTKELCHIISTLEDSL